MKEDLQLALTLHDPEEFDKFYNLALRVEAALLRVENSKKPQRFQLLFLYSGGSEATEVLVVSSSSAHTAV